MNVFLAWSGPSSHNVAEALRKWLPLVLQKVKPFLSSADINKGERWRNELAKQVESASFAILCLTPDTLTSTWIHFEAGAVSRQASEGRVTGLLVGVKPSEVVDPLAQFQNTPATEVEVKKLIQTLNKLLGEEKLEDDVLNDAFETYWPRLEKAIQAAQRGGSVSAPPKRTTDELLGEILENTRTQGRNLSLTLEMQTRLLNAQAERPPVVFGTGGLSSPAVTLSGSAVNSGAGFTSPPASPPFGNVFLTSGLSESAQKFFEQNEAQQKKLAKMIEELNSHTGFGRTTKPKKDDGKK